ncbi:MAG TPA: hypothetical protein VJ617_15590 [Arthrobacter sp.]|nr:hypothetical protein [Arthrobacter sp.]
MTAEQTETDTSVGFGEAEMAYLLHLQATEGSRASATWLRLSEESGNQDLIRAGLSSLIARGLATVNGSDIGFDMRVDIVAYTLANAQRWTQLDLLVDAEESDSVLHAESDRTALLFQPRTMMSWFALPQDPKISAEAAEAYIVRDHLTKNPDGGVRIRTGLLRGGRQLLIRKDIRGWVHAVALDDVVGDESLAQTDDELTAALSTFRSEAGAADGI